MPGPKPNLHSAVRVLLVAAALCCATGSIGCSQQSSMAGGQTPLPPGGSAPPPSAAVSFCESPDPACTPATSFSVSGLRDLSIRVQWNNLLPGNHVQTLDVFLPDGNVYESMETSFAIAQQPIGSTTTIQTLPVAGTFITERSLTGQWKFEISLDGEVMGSQIVRLDP